MSDVAMEQARREARRRRILENSENRLQRITGRYKEKSSEDNNINNDVTYSLPKFDNSISSNILTSETRSILEEKRLNFLEQDKSFDIKDYELDDSSTRFQNSDDLLSSEYPVRHSSKPSRQTFDGVIPSSTSSQANIDPNKFKNSYLLTLLYSPLCSIFLAAFMTVLHLIKENIPVYESIIIPYLIIGITRLCFQYNADNSQGSNMLLAALILCNIKPDIVRFLKKVLTLINTFSQGFALYITSFILMNWLISLFWNKSDSIQFF